MNPDLALRASLGEGRHVELARARRDRARQTGDHPAADLITTWLVEHGYETPRKEHP